MLTYEDNEAGNEESNPDTCDYWNILGIWKSVCVQNTKRIFTKSWRIWGKKKTLMFIVLNLCQYEVQFLFYFPIRMEIDILRSHFGRISSLVEMF